MKGCVLSFQLTDKENGQLKSLCEVMGVGLRVVGPEKYGETIGALAGLRLERGAPKHLVPLPEKLLVFAGVPDGALEVLLSMLRTMDIAVGSYKAALTETNRDWTVPMLFAELKAEREEIQKNT